MCVSLLLKLQKKLLVPRIENLNFVHLLEKVSPGSTTIAVFVDGTVSYDDGKPKIFSQNFVLNAEGDVWKVVSDCFRITP